ncbi:Ig-like domain-containing protein [bacterium]|nr:Ig-like domain-containing protein [bacterium]
MRMIVSVFLVAALTVPAFATAPVLSGIGVSPVNDTWAMVNWTTNISATSYVDYGPTASYGSTEYVAGYVTAHHVQLNNLSAATTYHYRVRSTNSSSETSVSGDYTFTTGAVSYGCEGNPTGNPIGGGVGYSRVIDSATANYVVSTASALKSALSSATSGQVVYVADDAKIDLSGQTSSITIKAGVTLASGRGRNGSLGGMIYSSTFNEDTGRGWFATGGTGTRVTGLRLAGAFNGPWRTDEEYHAIYVGHANCEIDNNEIYGWNYAAVETLLGSNACAPYFHHNYIHHNTKLGCGYGICPGFNSGNAVPIIEGNIFDFERHSVAGHGTLGMSYEARYNLVLEHSISHIFDMHGGYDRDDGTSIAGTIIRIHHNTVRNFDQSAVTIRGVPTQGNGSTYGGCWVNNNHMFRLYDSICIRQLYDFGNFWVTGNAFGADLGTTFGKWNFEEGAGATTAIDGTGNGCDGTLTGMNASTCWVAGHEGTGLKFLDSGDYVDCSYDIGEIDNIAFDCWVKFDSLPTGMYPMSNGIFDLYYRGDWAGNYMFFRAKITDSAAYPGDSGWTGYAAVKSTVPISTGQWYHYVGTRSGNKLQLYTNGVLDRELDCLAGYTVSTASETGLRFGQGVPGTMDDVQVYKLNATVSTAPTLTWTGEANYTDGGVYPKIATAADYVTFRVKYTDADGDEPKLGYPKLHILRHGVEFEYLTPLVMSAVDTASVASGRIYQYQVKVPRGFDYSYYFEAQDVDGKAATGAATVPVSGPGINTGNNEPVLYYATNDSSKYIENIMYPSSSGTSNTSFDIRCAYMDRDGDPPLDGYPKVKVMTSTGVEIPGSPFTMTQMDAGEFWDRRNYQLLKKFAAGSYKTQIIAYDSQGTAGVALPITAESHPVVTDGGTNWTDAFTGAPSPNPSMSFQVAVSFGQPTTNFVQGDVTVSNGTISGFTGSDAFYSFTVTATTAGTVTVLVPAGACTSTTGNANTASQTISRVCSAGDTNVSTNITSSAANPGTSPSFYVTVAFGKAVTGFTSGDIAVTNGSISGFTGSGQYYAFTVTASGEGIVTASIPAGATSPSNYASSVSRVYYPASGAANIWVGHGYPGAHLGTQGDPFDLITEGISWLANGGTMHILTGANPGAIRITKPMRIESYGGTARVGGS